MSRIVVANRYKLMRSGGKFVEANKVLERPNQKVLETYVEDTNVETHQHGILFVIDEKATSKRLKDMKAEGEKREAIKEASKVDTIELVKDLAEKLDKK